MEYRISVSSKIGIAEALVPPGVNLRRFLQQSGYELDTPCNGLGTCGKCQVRLSTAATLPEPTIAERKVFSRTALACGYRLACQITVSQDLQVSLEGLDLRAQVLTEGIEQRFPLAPALTKRLVNLPPATLDDQRPDSERLSAALVLDRELTRLELLRQLPEICHQTNSPLTLTLYRGEPLAAFVGDTTASLYGIAVDIGTTTIASYLLDLNTGTRLATYSALNPQKRFGADVISRIRHTMDEANGLVELHQMIIDAINLAARQLTTAAGLATSAVDTLTLVGNTTMIHFLLRIPAQNLAFSPFIPATTQTLTVQAAALGINLSPHAVAVIAPSVAAYIGADTVAAVLASGMNEQDQLSLLVDFGTNGEIVLGDRAGMLACATAAGPAFEGARIHNGVGGIQGAIDHYTVAPQPGYTTIGTTKPLGICGTGLIDLVASLHQNRIIDTTGAFTTNPEVLKALPPELVKRLTRYDGNAAFLIAKPCETAHNQPIVITQRDIRELQNAKAAIAAGIRVLVQQAGRKLQEIHRVYLAGGFGSYINIDNALILGLLPRELSGKITTIGNAAGTGAITLLLSEPAIAAAETIKRQIKYIELAACREFSDFFIDALYFPED